MMKRRSTYKRGTAVKAYKKGGPVKKRKGYGRKKK